MIEGEPGPAYLMDAEGNMVILGDSHRATVTRGFWTIGMKEVRRSLDTAKALTDAGFFSAGFVWAVRSVEIFFRQCVALCYYYDEGEDVERALKMAQSRVKSGNWSKVWCLVERFIEPDDPPLTDSDEDAWMHWKKHAVGIRDKAVHGLLDVDAADAAWVIEYAERVVSWVTQRLSIADRGPLRGLLRDMIRAMKEAAGDGTTATSH